MSGTDLTRHPAHVAPLIRRARERIEDRAHWTRYTLARDKHGRACDPRSNAAVSWCGVGALYAEAETAADRVGAEVLVAAIGASPLSHVNDTNGHQAVLDLFDRVLEENAR